MVCWFHHCWASGEAEYHGGVISRKTDVQRRCSSHWEHGSLLSNKYQACLLIKKLLPSWYQLPDMSILACFRNLGLNMPRPGCYESKCHYLQLPIFSQNNLVPNSEHLLPFVTFIFLWNIYCALHYQNSLQQDSWALCDCPWHVSPCCVQVAHIPSSLDS